jgi:hypothetical protein
MKIEKISFENNIELLQSKSNSTDIFFFPENFDEVKGFSNFIYSESTIDIKKVFNANERSISFLNDAKPLLRLRKSADWFGPTLFITFSTLTQNPELINVSLNLISNYLYDFFKGSVTHKNIKMDIIVENKEKKEYSKINYEGSIDGLKGIERIIKELKK